MQRYQFFLKLQNILAIISCERGSPTPFFCHLFSEVEKLNIARTGKLFERITKYNPYFNAANSADGKAYDAHFDLLPIPLSAIQANKDAKLEQNPGY